MPDFPCTNAPPATQMHMSHIHLMYKYTYTHVCVPHTHIHAHTLNRKHLISDSETFQIGNKNFGALSFLILFVLLSCLCKILLGWPLLTHNPECQDCVHVLQYLGLANSIRCAMDQHLHFSSEPSWNLLLLCICIPLCPCVTLSTGCSFWLLSLWCDSGLYPFLHTFCCSISPPLPFPGFCAANAPSCLTPVRTL